MAYTWVTLLLFVFLCFARVSCAVGSPRNLIQFNNMINYKGFSAWDYNGYGCWCGAGNHGSRVADDTDDCCRIHDQCYDRIAGGFFGCSPKLVTYTWKELPNKVIQCIDESGTCDRNACECDKAAVDCYERHRATYRADLLDIANRFGKDNSGRSKFCNP